MYSCKNADVCVPVFCFDETVLGDAARTDFGTLKWGPKRAKFLTESVTDLRKQLENIGSSLIVTKGKPEKVFDDLIGSLKDDFDVSIVCQEEVLKEEKDTVKAVQSVLKRHQPKAKVTEVWGSTMYDLKDLPFDANLASMPDVFTPFRNKVEKNCKISKPLPTPRTIPSLPKDSTASKALERMMTTIPTLQDLGYTDDQIEYANSVDPRGVMNFCGGETAALARVKDYIWDKDLLKVYFETRNGMIGADYSTKFSPWLAYGCLSPRQVAMECQKYEEQRVANKSTYWVVFELLWRDFCKFFCLKHGDAVFYPSGTIGKHKKWSTFQKNFDAWKEGKTGYPLVDANMRELNATGFMSNRGRQNVCSFLAIDLNHDWRMGEYGGAPSARRPFDAPSHT